MRHVPRVEPSEFDAGEDVGWVAAGVDVRGGGVVASVAKEVVDDVVAGDEGVVSRAAVEGGRRGSVLVVVVVVNVQAIVSAFAEELVAATLAVEPVAGRA